MAATKAKAKKVKEPAIMGRPRMHDRVKVAHDIVEWSKLPDSINLNKFCAYYEPDLEPSMVIRWAKEDPDFRRSYERAKAYIGFRREEMLNKNTLHVKAYHLNSTTYDIFMKDEVRDQMQYEANLTKEDPLATDVIVKLDDFMNFLGSTQTRNIDDSSIKADAKS